jgi:hypothetical protein
VTNINDMGLPAGLPVVPLERVEWFPIGPWVEWGYHREMTAADLGLPLPQWTREFVCYLYGDDWFNRTYAEWLRPPPYFWLGTQAEAA